MACFGVLLLMPRHAEHIRASAKQVMTTKGQKGCYVVDHMVAALMEHSSSSIRRAIILTDIDQYEGTVQANILGRVDVGKSALNRDIDWLFNHGCIRRFDAVNDGRKIKLRISDFSKKHLDAALDYYDGDHERLKGFLEGLITILKDDKATLRDAKIILTLYEKPDASKQDIVNNLYKGSPSTVSRAIVNLINEGIIEDHV